MNLLDRIGKRWFNFIEAHEDAFFLIFWIFMGVVVLAVGCLAFHDWLNVRP